MKEATRLAKIMMQKSPLQEHQGMTQFAVELCCTAQECVMAAIPRLHGRGSEGRKGER